jgi:hypothetical protein
MGWRRLGAHPFDSCDSLRHIVIPNTVKAIKRGTFHGYEKLTTVNLEYGLEEIWDSAIFF